MKLSDIFKNAPEIEIEQLSSDSRLPMRNAIFFCLDGIKYNGHDYIDEAISNGAKVIVYDKELDSKSNAIYVKVRNVNETLIKVADIFYNFPNNTINSYIISGCNGRSTISKLIYHYLNKVNNCGSVGVFGINYLDKHLDTSFPALTPLENIKVLDNLKKNGIHNVVFESSVISLFYKKLDVIKPKIFIYTNTNKSSIDYKVCNNQYYEYLRKYLYTLEEDTCVLFNLDDESFENLNDSVTNYATYGTNENANYRICNIEILNDSSSFDLIHEDITYKVESKLLSLVNIYNLTAGIAALNIEGYDIQDIIDKFYDIERIDGVVDKVDDNYNIYIDCGYEIENIEKMFEFGKRINKGKMIGVIGINYSDSNLHIKNLMQLCEHYLDKIILTEDESLQGEIMSILASTDKYSKSHKVIHVPLRSIAIENAINILNTNDTLLILGKGNEKFLSMGLGKEKYNGDKYYVNKFLKKRKEEENEII